MLARFFFLETVLRFWNTGRPAGSLFLHLLLGGQIDATGWAIMVTGWAFAHPVGTLEEALDRGVALWTNGSEASEDKLLC